MNSPGILVRHNYRTITAAVILIFFGFRFALVFLPERFFNCFSITHGIPYTFLSLIPCDRALLTVKEYVVVILCWPSSSSRYFSVSGEPIMNVPGGMTTISGHISQSLKILSVRPTSSADVAIPVIRLIIMIENILHNVSSRFMDFPFFFKFINRDLNSSSPKMEVYI